PPLDLNDAPARFLPRDRAGAFAHPSARKRLPSSGQDISRATDRVSPPPSSDFFPWTVPVRHTTCLAESRPAPFPGSTAMRLNTMEPLFRRFNDVRSSLRPRMSWRDVWPMLRETYKEWDAAKAPRMGAALAFFAIISMAPLLVLVLGVVALVF